MSHFGHISFHIPPISLKVARYYSILDCLCRWVRPITALLLRGKEMSCFGYSHVLVQMIFWRNIYLWHWKQHSRNDNIELFYYIKYRNIILLYQVVVEGPNRNFFSSEKLQKCPFFLSSWIYWLGYFKCLWNQQKLQHNENPFGGPNKNTHFGHLLLKDHSNFNPLIKYLQVL